MTNDKEQKLKAAAENAVKDFLFIKKESYTESDMWITFKRMFIEGAKSEAAREYWDHNCLENFTNDKAGMYICNICKRSIEKEIAELSENQKTELIVNKNMNLFKNLRASEQAKEIKRLTKERHEYMELYECVANLKAEISELKSQLEAKAVGVEKSDAWISAEQEPEFGGEYNVLYDLEDGESPLVTTMDYDKINKLWMDTRGANIPIHTVLFWKPLPEPPKNFTSNT